MNKKIIDPFFMFLPAIFTVGLVVSGVLWLFLAQLYGILAILKIVLPIIKLSAIVSSVGFFACFAILVITKNFVTYIKSISPTLYVHENLKIYAKISDYRNSPQSLTYSQKAYNSCSFNSYIWLGENEVKVVIMLPRNNEAQELLISKLPNLRRDLASRFSYSFGGKFEQIGGFMVLTGSRIN
ncbi:MAG: hypothetical protein MR841_02985 [Lactobacillus johnsonii]|nr:hypothetical protein [Lactobacillus johnsonii]